MVEPEACRDIEAGDERPLVLHVDGSGPVARLPAIDSGGGFQPVVTEFGANTQLVLVGERQHALELCHGALLVALQLCLVGQIGEIGIIDGAGALLVVFHKGGRREIVIVGMAVPVDVEGDDIGVRQFPLAAHCRRCVVVLHVVGLHVVVGVFAARTVDAFPIDTPVGIQFQGLGGFVGEPLCHLPVGVAVDGLVPGVVDGGLRTFHMFLARILPTVAVLELEIGVGTQFAEAQGDAVVLAEVAITAHACGVFQQDALLLVFPGDDVDDAGDGVAAVEGARRSFHNLYLLDVVRVDERQVVLPAYVAMYALAVDEDENVGVAKAVDLHLRPHVVFVEGKRRRQPSKYVLDASPCIVAKHFRGDIYRS